MSDPIDELEAAAVAKHRSPNYPAFGLKKALDKIAVLFERARTAPIPATVACKYLDLSPTSSTGMRTMATLQEFNLLAKDGRGAAKSLKVTELGRVLLKHPDRASHEYRDAVHAAALAPQVHQRIWNLRTDGHLPPDEALVYRLTGPEWGYSEVAAEAVLQEFRETIAYAGLTDVTTEDDTQEASTPALDQEDALPPGGGEKPPRTSGWKSSTAMNESTDTAKDIPLALQSGGVAVLHLPYTLDESDYEWVMGLLQGLKRSMLGSTKQRPPTPSDGGDIA